MKIIKRIIILLAILGIIYTLIPKEVFYDSPNIKLGGGRVFYKNKPFTGKLLKTIPLIDKTVSVTCIDGEITSFPSDANKNVEILEIPGIDKFIKYNSKAEKISDMFSIITY